MAERLCMIERGEGFFDVEKLVPSPKLAKHLADVGADIWMPNPNKGAHFPLPVQKARFREQHMRDDLYPVWGIHYLDFR